MIFVSVTLLLIGVRAPHLLRVQFSMAEPGVAETEQNCRSGRRRDRNSTSEPHWSGSRGFSAMATTPVSSCRPGSGCKGSARPTNASASG